LRRTRSPPSSGGDSDAIRILDETLPARLVRVPGQYQLVGKVGGINTTGTFMNQSPVFQTLMQAYTDYQPIRVRTVNAPSDTATVPSATRCSSSSRIITCRTLCS
jgi:hypothetical protein